MDVTPAIERAVAELEPGGRLVDVRALAGGVSANVLGLEIVTAAGTRRRVVFRQHRPSTFKQHEATVAAKEHGVLAALHRSGFAVPEPYRYDDGDDAGPYLVVEWVDGSTELGPGELPGALDQMARFLAGLHGLDPNALQLPDLEPIEDPAEAVIPHLPSSDTGRRTRAALRSRVARDGEPRRALLHGDYWPGNVLWRDGRLAAVIDWEDACLGDPLADLATARVELLCRYGDDAVDTFTARYVDAHQRTVGPLQLDELPVWELYVSASALASMGQWGLEPAEEALRRRRTQRCFDRAVHQLG
jgi:aminoglycoside phosphotransferase (APT) family kinase protein